MLPDAARLQVIQIWSDYRKGDACKPQIAQTETILRTMPEEVLQRIFPRLKPPCGIPPFINLLPIEYRMKLEQIWIDYRMDSNATCDNEIKATGELVKSLPIDLQKKVTQPIGPPCGLPPFIDKLPYEYKAQVESIWSHYRGGECPAERQATEQVVRSLPMDVRVIIFPPLPHLPCGMPPFKEKFPDAAQLKLEAIWAEYKDVGSGCVKEAKETEELIYGLSEEVRKDILVNIGIMLSRHEL